MFRFKTAIFKEVILVLSDKGKFRINICLKINLGKKFQNNILFIEEYQLQLLTVNCVSSMIPSFPAPASFTVKWEQYVNPTGVRGVWAEGEENEER